MALITLLLCSCDDGDTKTTIGTSDMDGTVSHQTVIHNFTFPKQVLELANVRIEYLDDDNDFHSIITNDIHVQLPTLTYTVVFGKPRTDYGIVRIYFEAKPNIDEILQNGDYSHFLTDKDAELNSKGTSKHEDGVFGGSFTCVEYFRDMESSAIKPKEYSKDEIKKILTRNTAIHTFKMQWGRDEDNEVKWTYQTSRDLKI